MKKQILISFLCGLVLPLALMAAVISREEEPDGAPEQTQAPAQETQPQQMLAILDDDGQTRQVTMEEYLTGVVLAEMPADFPEEALKAQAVAARTFTMKRLDSGGKHGQAAVCTQPSCCQGYCTPESYLAGGGTQESVDKVAQAVAQTAGEVLTYDGELIDATYFSCSGGSTEAAVAVWGSDVPYLQAVESPGEEDAAHYTDTVTFTAAQFAEKTGCAGTGQPESWFGEVTYTDGGGVETMRICDEEYEGTELRQLLGLRSTVFEISVQGDEIVIETRGYGHRVGMSQYGARAMAEAGSGYREILEHYYQGTVLENREQ